MVIKEIEVPFARDVIQSREREREREREKKKEPE
jgi:hypothetical protein